VVPVGIAAEGARAALETGERDLASAVEIWEARRDLIVRELADFPLRSAAGGWSMLLDAGELGCSGTELSQALFEKGRIAATPMVNWGRVHGAQYVRLVFSNEPVQRLRGIGERVRVSLS
jgi:aspartate/methionine/tyrosine aminotransferase